MMGLQSTEASIQKLFAKADTDKNGLIDFNEFIKILADQKMTKASKNDNELINAYVALGGQDDQGGHIDAEILI